MKTASFWRIAADTPAYVADDLTGRGAEKTGGRWNSTGTPMVYASSSIALAVLETLVHLGACGLPLNRYLVRIDVPSDLVASAARAQADRLVGWDALPAGKVSVDWGSTWCASASSLVALVPSVIVAEEFNLLLNPRHADAAKVRATKIRKWLYDPRARLSAT
ncbi:RES family NAD+ phosphorylase [Caenimonas sp. SL110]|uniref:RES family NAD+ phosphorylase n=1 Tax=Caenimonas sp. SL110 TaxID=1450524 RepID=UPI000653C601|nr:RES family NAD+ phosphorylase [Caenimonas sp. SL110]